jgi:hypothetical protein
MKQEEAAGVNESEKFLDKLGMTGLADNHCECPFLVILSEARRSRGT